MDAITAIAKKGEIARYKGRLGLSLFSYYLLLFSGFVLINLVKPSLFQEIIFANISLAEFYGSGLLIFAGLFALIYNLKSNKFAKKVEGSNS